MDLSTGTLTPFRGHEDIVHDVSFLPDGKRLISASADGRVALWDPDFYDAVWWRKAHDQEVSVIAVVDDGNTFITGSVDVSAVGADTGEIRLWHVDDPKPLATFGLADFGVSLGYGVVDLAIAPQSDVFVAAAENRALVWSTYDTAPLMEIDHQAPVLWVDFSHDGSFLLTASGDGLVRYWKIDRSFIDEPYQQIENACNLIDQVGIERISDQTRERVVQLQRNAKLTNCSSRTPTVR